MKYLLLAFIILPLSIRGATLGVSYDSVSRNVLQTDLDYVGATANFTSSLQRNGVNVVDANLTLTMTGTAGEITLSAGAQSLAANRTWTFSLPTTLTFTGKTINGGTYASSTLTAPTIASFANATHSHQNAAGGGTLDAAAIAAGTVATARLGSGTANSSTFLRGDQTWATPAGSGDFVGPASSTNNNLIMFGNTTGKLGADSGIATDGAGSITTAGSGSFGSGNGQIDVGSTGIRFTSDGDGAGTFLGRGDGADEAWTFNLDDTANTVVMSSSTGVTLFDFLTGSFAISVNTIELGNATANTLSASGGVLSIEGVALQTASSTADFTNKGYDAAGTGNTLKQTKQLILQRPDYGDGTGAIPQTNTFNVSGLMHYTFSGNAETNANWVVYEFVVPSDLDTTVAVTATFNFLSGGTDADDYVFHLTYAQQAVGAAYVTGTSIATSPIVMTVTPTTAANGDLQSSAATTLTGWAASLTPGTPIQIRVARLQNAQDDGARGVSLVFTYGSTL
jgi:hypothetical protein